MKMTKVHFTCDGTKRGHALTLEDGTAIDQSVQAVTVHANAGELPYLEVIYLLPHVDVTGWVDHAALRAQYDAWQAQVAEIAAEFESLLTQEESPA